MAPQSYLIGITGPSGAGKSFLAQRLSECLDAPVVSLDQYYRDLSNLPLEDRARSNFDEPAALEHELLIAQVKELRNGNPIAVPVYDFSLHARRCEARPLGPSPFVILEGLFTLHWPELRDVLDTAVFVQSEQSVCLQRRLERDVRERGRTPDSVIGQFRTTVAAMAERYVIPTVRHADVVVSGTGSVDLGVAKILDHVRQHLQRRGTKSLLQKLSSFEPASS